MSGRRDYIIVREWINGNKSAGEKLISETYDKVFSFISCKVPRSTPNRQEMIEDIVNESFVRTFKKIDEFNGSCLLYTWICGYAKNCIKEKWKEIKNSPIVLDFSSNESDDENEVITQEFEISDFNNPERIIVLKEEYEAVRKAFFSLKEEYREIIHMKLVLELTYKEISSRLGKNIDNVESLFRRAIKGLCIEFKKIYK